MKFTAAAALALTAAPSLVAAQIFTECDPTKKSCPPNPALAGTASFDMKSASDRFIIVGNSPTYGDDGASFTINKQGEAPTLQSKFYIMFGHLDVEIKAAPGQGIVSSVFMVSDSRDEIDWEWVGGNNGQVQTNFFGKGQTATYDRSVWHPNPGNQDAFHKYSIDWTSERIEFSIDGNLIRTVTPNDANAKGQYPQTPMRIRFGSWAGGDPNNSQGTIDWAGGLTDFSKAPFTMQLKNVVVTDYSTGKEYRYKDQSGTWQSIEAVDGEVHGSGTPGSGPQVESSLPPAEATIAPSQGMTSGSGAPSVYPWIPKDPSKTPTTASASVTGFPGLPSSWLVTDDGRPSTPSTASTDSRISSSPSPSSSDSQSSGGPEPSETGSPSRPTGDGATFVTSGLPVTSGGTNPSATEAPPNAAAHLSSPYYGFAAICGIMGLAVLL
ncbi:conserved hypothetical protein [Uncinocarpus reesii 1704]|uniref:Crh-like protein n=1 Tax=Uncinocarpus reesii (strain UAMH 1704) TaxID=336963 RepID=C4JFW4_UNCRE|nr:uncharacterized protein UREG_01044 [Uncinocarpus reesii 1704]EEP76195.1 conserved hypothetical protein [Uncinocarpus reesii 1704]